MWKMWGTYPKSTDILWRWPWIHSLQDGAVFIMTASHDFRKDDVILVTLIFGKRQNLHRISTPSATNLTMHEKHEILSRVKISSGGTRGFLFRWNATMQQKQFKMATAEPEIHASAWWKNNEVTQKFQWPCIPRFSEMGKIMKLLWINNHVSGSQKFKNVAAKREIRAISTRRQESDEIPSARPMFSVTRKSMKLLWATCHINRSQKFIVAAAKPKMNTARPADIITNFYG